MKLSDKYRPTALSDIVGQFPVAMLRRFVQSPHSECFCLVGLPGTGKSATAFALANELGCVDEMSGLFKVNATDLGIDRAKALFERSLRLIPMTHGKWRVLWIEELELLSPQCQVYLKVALEDLPSKTVVVATSNGLDKLQPALVERFTVLNYLASKFFAVQCLRRLKEIWQVEVGTTPPEDMASWGVTGDRFSFRLALQKLQQKVDGIGQPATIRSSVTA